jgi:hypothetical protein
MSLIYNGMSAADLRTVTWQKAAQSNSQGNCVELAKLPDGRVAMRNSRHPEGAALIYTKAEMDAFLHGAKAGEFDQMV